MWLNPNNLLVHSVHTLQCSLGEKGYLVFTIIFVVTCQLVLLFDLDARMWTTTTRACGRNGMNLTFTLLATCIKITIIIVNINPINMNLDLERTIHVGNRQTTTFLVVGRA